MFSMLYHPHMYLLFSPSVYFAELCDYVVVWLQAGYASELQPIWELFNEALWFIQFWAVFLLGSFFLFFFFFLKEVFYERFFPLGMLATCPK